MFINFLRKYVFLLFVMSFLYLETSLLFLISNSFEEVKNAVFSNNFMMIFLLGFLNRIVDDIYDYDIDFVRKKTAFPKVVLRVASIVIVFGILIQSWPDMLLVNIPMIFLIYIFNNNLLIKSVDFSYIKYINFPLFTLYFFATTTLTMNEICYLYIATLFILSFTMMYVINQRKRRTLR